MRTDEIHPGDLIAGKFRVRTILGRKHGLLVEAFHTEFDQRVVIKILLAGYGDDKEIERFRREARTLSKLESEHVARIIDVGTQQDGSFYLVRQFLEGIDLETHVRQCGAQSLQDAILYVLQAAEAVAETHSHGIIVRELEPRNLFLTTRAGSPCVKVIDFGTAKLMRDIAAPTAGGDLTATAMFGLSPYSSPELVRKAKNVDQRTDVWSLGACLYQLLTGVPPFSGETAMLMLQITKEEPTPLCHLRPDLPPEIDSIIGWALAKDLDARFRNVHALAHALAPYASTEGQVLVERIGRMTEASRSKRSGAPAPASAPYSSRPNPAVQSARSLDFDDSVTHYQHAGMAPQSYAAPRSRPASVPPAPPSLPPGYTGPASPASPASIQPATMMATQPAMFPVMSDANGRAQKAVPLDRRVALGALAAAAVLLPLLIAVLFLRGGIAGDANAGANPETRITVQQPGAAQEPTLAPLPTQATTAAGSGASATGASTRSTPVAAANPPPRQVAPQPQPQPQPHPQPQPQPQPQAQPPSPPPAEAPAASGGMGTLVAVATGGTCAFSVNGASQGSGASTKVQLKPGDYSVTCKPSGGAAKSRSVTVKSGETAMVSFKL